MSGSRALRWFGIAFGLVVFGFVLATLAGQWQALQFSWSDLAWPALGLSTLFFVAAQALFAGAWHRLVSDAGESAELRGDVARWCVSLAGKYLPGKVWQAVARFGLYHGAQRGRKVAPAFVRETCLSLSAAMALVAAHGWLDAAATGRLELVLTLGSVLLLLLSLPGIALIVVGWLDRWTPFRVAIPAGGAGEMAVAWLMQVSGYFLLGLGLVALARGLGIDQPGMGWPMIAGLSFAGLAGITAFFVPAGIGVREAALVWYLSPIIGLAPAALLAVAARIWISLGEAALVGSGLLMLRDSNNAVTGNP